MADTERDRVRYFRQRWAQGNHYSNADSSHHPQQPDQVGRGEGLGSDVALTEINAADPAQPEGLDRKIQKQSWRQGLRAPFGKLAPVDAPSPASSRSTSIRSPVDSRDNTIYSDEAQRGRNSSPPKGSPSQSRDTAAAPAAWLTELYILSWLTFFALLGTLARLGVEAVTQYPDAPVTSRVLWANLGGSFAMGFLVEDRNLFGLPNHLHPQHNAKEGESPSESQLSTTHMKFKKTIPLYVGLSTGFCGSFTSFSSFIRDAFLALTNDLSPSSSTTPYHSSPTSYPRNGGYSVLALLAILIIHPAISLAALKTGGHVALALRPILPQQLLPATFTSKILNPLFVFIGLTSWLIGALFLTIFPPSTGPSPVDWRARATIPLLLAPPGCILRYYLAKLLNRPSTPNLPWGTFAANVFGTLILGMAWDLQHARSIGAAAGHGTACAVLLGVQEGFCGCLTTVSTWVLELSGLGRKAAWVYGGVSVLVSFAGMVVVMGSMGWTVGFATPVCG